MNAGSNAHEAAHPAGGSPTVVIIQTTIPGYRVPFFATLSDRLGSRLSLLSGDEDWSLDVRHVDDVAHVRLRNVFLAKRRLLWQGGSLRATLSADIVVLDLNPRILSAWAALIGRRLLGRKTILWGHAWPRKGRASWTDRVRSGMRRIAGSVIAYTEREAAELRRSFPGLSVTAAPNALYHRDVLRPVPTEERPSTLLYVGRLSPSKRVDIVIDAFRLVEETLPDDVRLVVVGDGVERTAISERAAGSSRIELLGHVSAIAELQELYGRAIASVSAGEVGLAIIQSIGFGVPMILPRHANHGPEIEAVREGVNSITITPLTTQALADAMVAVVRERDSWVARRPAIAASARDRYSLETMVDAFVEGLGVETRPAIRSSEASSGAGDIQRSTAR